MNSSSIKKALFYMKFLYFAEILVLLTLLIYRMIMFFGVTSAHSIAISNNLIFLLIGLLFFNVFVLGQDLSKFKSLRRALSAQNDTLENIENLNMALRSQRHDFLNHVQILYSLTELGEYKEIEIYLNRLYGDLESLNQHIKTSQPAINALLLAKEQTAKKQGIQYDTLIQSQLNNLGIPAWELCRCLANLIDNSFTALVNCETPRVRVTISEDISTYYLSVENNGPAISAQLKEKIFIPGFTTKKETNHGMGLHIVKQTLEAFQGHLSLESDEDTTLFRIALAKQMADN